MIFDSFEINSSFLKIKQKTFLFIEIRCFFIFDIFGEEKRKKEKNKKNWLEKEYFVNK